jgi:osmotically-inducible protein OsmY
MDQSQTDRRNQYQGGVNDQPRQMTQQGGRDLTQSGGDRHSGQSGGDWQGYVIPYRYYGPGYAGVGYYAVYFQGGQGASDDDRSGTSTFDQNQVRYGQGQGAGAAYGQAAGTQQQGGQRQTPGTRTGFAGRGPKGYRRSDERIREEISDRLTEHDELDASDIEVKVQDGEVTLTGTVDDKQAKRLASDVAEEAGGVHDVMNQLKVSDKSGGRQTTSSSTTSTRARASRTGTSGSSQAGTRSQAGVGRSRTRTKTGTQTETQGSERQPVGAAAGGATDGATGNGSNTRRVDQDSR